MTDAEKRFNQLVKEHECLTRKYNELEELEVELENDKKMSAEEKAQKWIWLATRYEYLSKKMSMLAFEAKELKESLG